MLADRISRRVATRDVRRAQDVTLDEFAEILGMSRGLSTKTKAGVTMNTNRALGIPAWYSGCRYLAEGVSFLPVRTFRGTQSNRTQRADPSWLTKPDEEMPWPALVEHWLMSLFHRGDGYSFKLRNAVGQVTGLRALHPDRVKVGRASNGQKVFQVDGRTDIGFTSREILHIPGLSYDGVSGLDPIRYHAESLGTIAAANEIAARSLGQGSHLQGYISTKQPLKGDQADRIQAEWQKFHQGLGNVNITGVLGGGAEYNTITLTPEQMQLLETRRWGVIEVAQILRIPPHKLYELTRATFSNIEQQTIEAVVDSLRPWIERIETWVNFDPDLLPARNFIEFDIEGLLRGDSASRASFYTAGITGGWITPQFAARKENAPAPDELDYYLRPLNMAVIKPGVGEIVPDTAPVEPQ